MHNNTNPELVNIYPYAKYFIKFPSFSLEIMSRYEILTRVKGHNSFINLQILTQNNPNIDLVNINVYAKSR